MKSCLLICLMFHCITTVCMFCIYNDNSTIYILHKINYLQKIQSVISLGAIFIAINSWKSNFAAYGSLICAICVLFLQPLHSKVLFRKFAIAIKPQKLHMWILYGSDTSNKRSRRNCAAPWEIWQSRSISPKRSPPSLNKYTSMCVYIYIYIYACACARARVCVCVHVRVRACHKLTFFYIKVNNLENLIYEGHVTTEINLILLEMLLNTQI